MFTMIKKTLSGSQDENLPSPPSPKKDINEAESRNYSDKRRRSGSKESDDKLKKKSWLERSEAVAEIVSDLSSSDSEYETEESDAESINIEELSARKDEIVLSENAPAWGKELLSILREDNKQVNDNLIKLAGAHERKVRKINKSLEDMNKKMCDLVLVNEHLSSENRDLREKVLDLEYRQRRNNLVFDGIREHDGEQGSDCYNKIIAVLNNIMDTKKVRVARCHRVGAPSKSKFPRPIIACFDWYGDVTTILNSRKRLPKGIYVNDDLPDEWKDRRRALRPVYQLLKRDPSTRSKVHWSKDKLIYDGKAYTAGPVGNMAELAGVIDLPSTCERQSDNVVAFHGIHSVFSNFHPSPFKLNGESYINVEQYIQAKKASVFDDDITRGRLLRAKNPYLIKRLGSRVKKYEETKWNQVLQTEILPAVMAKFTQNPLLGEMLKLSGTKVIVEATVDKIWGTGVPLKSKECLQESSWHGRGLMSNLLEKVRYELKSKK